MRKMKKKNINLYEQYQKTLNVSKKKKLSTKNKLIIMGSFGFVVLAGIYVVFRIQLNSIQAQYDDLYSKIYSDAAAEQSVNSERLEYENQILQLISDKYEKTVSGIEEGNKITRTLYPALISDILSCQTEGTKIKSISYDKGIVYINVETLESPQASSFVKSLDNKKIFVGEVKYGGYNKQGDVYVFSATGYLSEKYTETDNRVSLDDILEAEEE